MYPHTSSSPLRFLVRPDAGWHFSLYPDAGEGGGSFQYSVRRVPDYVARGSARDPERAAAEAGRRARARLRRYCAANRLNRLGTLTYAGSGNHDPGVLREHLADFFRSLRESLGGCAALRVGAGMAQVWSWAARALRCWAVHQAFTDR